MDYLIYLSRSKIEMLHTQLPAGLGEQLGAELGASLGVVTAKVKTGTPAPPGLYEKARRVEAQLEKTRGLGSLGEPQDWIRDRCEARYVSPSFSPALFLLVGKTGSGYFLLGGSAQNIVGNESAGSIRGGLSYLPYFLHAFREAFAEWEEQASAGNFWSGRDRAHIRHGSGGELALSVRELYDASAGVKPLQVRFVARRLATEASESGETRSHVYSPLYVAMAD